jgi:hypothetical protein
VSLYDHHHKVGQEFGGRRVLAGFGPKGVEWAFGLDGTEVARCAARQISREAVLGMGLSRRPGRSARHTAARRGRDADGVADAPTTQAEAARRHPPPRQNFLSVSTGKTL